MMAKLHRYWIEFEVTLEDSPILHPGCGVTAFTLEDGLRLVSENMLEGKPLPKIRSITEDVDVSTLDPKHVLPNMGITVKRGIWFPSGY